ncbi:recombinase family protein [Anaerotignum propionicum]|uniref:DNA-invertase hin n=1 Tax=Anaerotignum propionicum DSM 1682 TaxID=991789 RepID=A0A0X1U7Y1_ANAPI|nr:recombinase family protein [Anaerotignum propionicum]AMJ41049.1 DNA-invertase hin [Anaerotignum propionicum DSM 1682]SHE62230.1 site-specific DNA recombinase [[Clostridium] propionicum DSM 1682] [Anaerotignum propionicum DSM 1682]
MNEKYMVFGYVRVSTDNQLENYSIDEQIDRLTAYCKAKGWVLVKIYTDGGFSGGNTNRPALRQMLEDMKKADINAVIVYKLDRLSRSQKDTLMLIEDEFLSNNVDFVSINENFDTSTPFGRAMIGILSVFAQLEKDQITERFTMGRIGRGKAGYFHGGGNSPYGYDYVNGELLVNEYEAMQIEEIFDLFITGKSMNAITKIMRGKYENRNWTATAVRNALKNRIYIGKVQFKGIQYDGKHTSIISPEQFKEVQHLLYSKERENRKTTAQKSPFRGGYLLSSFIYCSRCGARYSANHGYYKCYSRSKSSKKFITDPNCKNENWNIVELDTLVVETIRELIGNKEMIHQLTSKIKPNKDDFVDTKKVNARMESINKQLSKLIDLYQVGTLPMEILTSKVEALVQEKNMLLERQNVKEDKIHTAANFIDTLNTFETYFETFDLDAKRMLIATLIECIKIDGKNVEIKWRL